MNWAIRGDKEPDKNKQLHIFSVKEYKELNEKLTKYKRAFEILKDKGFNGKEVITRSFSGYRTRKLINEEAELLEELMKSEAENRN